MSEAKISEAHKLAYETGMYYSQNEKCQPGVPFYAFTQGELDRFVERLTNLHPQPAELAEPSGNSGEMGEQQGVESCTHEWRTAGGGSQARRPLVCSKCNQHRDHMPQQVAKKEHWLDRMAAIEGRIEPSAREMEGMDEEQVGEVPTFDVGLEKWLRDRDLMPDYQDGLVEMEEVIEALNEHERMLMLPAQVGEVQGDALSVLAQLAQVNRHCHSRFTDYDGPTDCAVQAAIATLAATGKQKAGEVPAFDLSAETKVCLQELLDSSWRDEDQHAASQIERLLKGPIYLAPPAQQVGEVQGSND